MVFNPSINKKKLKKKNKSIKNRYSRLIISVIYKPVNTIIYSSSKDLVIDDEYYDLIDTLNYMNEDY